VKRDDRLRDLSDDHHAALVLARRARNAGALAHVMKQREVWDAVARAFAQDLAPHFAIEERLLLPALTSVGEGALAERVRAEHVALRALLDDPRALATRLSAFGDLLRDHVRFEEREVFPVAQEKLSSAALDAVALACRAARAGT
jgi:hemerythrin-like domain-containing protein